MKSPKTGTGFVTQQTIASVVGVSRETVAQILSGKEAHRYNEETQRKVHEAAQALGYRPNRAAQIMRKGRSNLIGILHFGSGHHLAHQATQFLPQALHSHGFDPLVTDLSWHGGCYQRAIEQLIDARVEGAIIAYSGDSFHDQHVELLRRVGIPLVTFSGIQRPGIPVFFGDVTAAFEKIVSHLASVGHQKILFLAKKTPASAPRSRVAGFEQGLARNPHLEGSVIFLPDEGGSFDPGQHAYDYAKQLIAKGNLPDAIVCNNDQWAHGVISAALEAGLRVPDDLAVTGFDNDPISARAPFRLTTASVDISAQCQLAVKTLVDLIAKRPLIQSEFIFPCPLIIRQSCGVEINKTFVS